MTLCCRDHPVHVAWRAPDKLLHRGRTTRSAPVEMYECLPAPAAAEWAELMVAVVQEQNVQPLAPMATKGDKLAKLEADRALEQQLAAMVCSLENKEACMACGS